MQAVRQKDSREELRHWRVGSDTDWADSYALPLSAELIRNAGFRDSVWRGYNRQEVDDLLERVSIRLEAHQQWDDLISSVRFDVEPRGYETDDVQRLIDRLGGSMQARQVVDWLPLGRRALGRRLLWAVGASFVVALVAIGVAYLTSANSRSQIWPILGFCGIGVAQFASTAKRFVNDEAFHGNDVRSFLLSCVLVIGGFGGAVVGTGDNAGWGRFSAVALGVVGLPAFTLYLRGMWLYFRDPAGGRHSIAPMRR